MSERKTTEIKLRVSPDEKTSWQLAAEEEGVGLSEFARRAMNDRASRPAEGWDAQKVLFVSCEEFPVFSQIAERGCDSSAVARLESYDGLPNQGSSAAPIGVPTSGEVDRVKFAPPVFDPEVAQYAPLQGAKDEPKPWTFEARKSG